MAGEIFRKTEAGLAALRQHGALEPRWRTLMVLVNGERTVEVLRQQLGQDPRPALLQLREQGLVELARRVVPPPVAAPAPRPPAPAPAPAPAAPPADEARQLRARQSQALDLLQRNFGPGADELAEPLLRARSLAAFGDALAPLQEKLAVYQGKKRAAELIRSLMFDTP
ncbi:MAG: hypothetical protein U1F53_10000 [Burkholderiaceae bacterium]